jgi:hypothetical protein
MNYSDKHIAECIAYLQFSVKNGNISEEQANELIKKKDWKAVYDLMDKGDAIANEKGD